MSTSRTRRPARLALSVLGALLAIVGLLPGAASGANGPQVFVAGTAPFVGDARNLALNAGIIDFAPTPSGNGYVQVASDGGVLTYGDAEFFGSTGNLQLNAPMVAIAMAAGGNGYYFLARDGGVFSFGGGASFYGSGSPTGKTFVDMVVAPGGEGYWLLASDGSVHAFGTTGVGSQTVTPAGAARAVALAVNPAGNGLWMAHSDGSVHALGAAVDHGDAPAGTAVEDLTAAPDGSGLWVVTAAGAVHAIGSVTLTDDVVADRPVVAIAAHSASGYWVATEGNGPGSISGRVLDDLGQPASPACLFLNDSPSPRAQTAADGTFRIASVSNGTYRLKIGSCPGDDRWAFEYYKDARSSFEATPITVTSAQEAALGDIVIDRAGAITGVVRGHDGEPLAGACVGATSTPSVSTSVTGYYRLGGIGSGSYVVQFGDCGRDVHLGEYYDDAPVFELATPVEVAAGQTRSGIDAQLAKAGAISGVVTTADGGELGASCVVASGDNGTVKQVPVTVTGFYRAAGLRSGNYKVHFNDCSTNFFPSPPPRNDYVDEWWNDQPSEATAGPVTVVAGAAADVTANAVLARGGAISGVVTQPNGSPVVFHCVDAVQGATSIRTTTTITGYYELKGLRPGAHHVRFASCYGVSGFAAEWWSDAPSLDTSTAVDVTAGGVRSGVNAVLDPAGYLEGRVTDAQGNGVRACVDVYDEALRVSFGNVANHNGITGNYRVGGLNDSGYHLRFRDCRLGTHTDGLAHEWFQDAATIGESTPLVAAKGETRAVPTAVLDLDSGISGVVTNDAGQPISGVCVRAFLPDGSDVLKDHMQVSTTVTGFYRVPRLPASSYKVFFDNSCFPRGYTSEWWNDSSSMAAATAVTTVAGQTTPGVDAVLSIPGRGLPAAPATVTATAARRAATVSWSEVSGANGAITGYRITASPGGAVRDVGADARSVVFDGLTPGQSYRFAVQAKNAFGHGPTTTSNAVLATGPPTAPGRPSATPGDGSVSLSWSAASDNGEPITEHVIRSSDGAELRVAGNVTSALFGGRPNGVGASYTVQAVNAAGAGPESPASDIVVPSAPAPAPAPAPAGAEPITAGSSDTEALPAGSTVLFSGDGFKPFEPGDVIINSTPRKLASFVTDAAGSFSVTVTIPADMELGSHTLVARSKAPDGTVRSLSSPVVVVPNTASTGYRLLAADGGIFTFGDAGFFGSAGGTVLRSPIVAGATTPSGDGYWLVGADGAVFTFGDANFHGSLGGVKLNKPIVGMASTPTGKGYWLVASDGGMFAFGDAQFLGSTGDLVLNKPIVGMTASPTGKGYWLVATDGGIFSFGDAEFFGSTGAMVLNKPIVGMTASPTGKGYWLTASDGGIFSFGDAQFFGSTGDLVLNKPIVGMAAGPKGDGYRLVASDGGIFAFGDAAFLGSTGNLVLAKPILALL